MPAGCTVMVLKDIPHPRSSNPTILPVTDYFGHLDPSQTLTLLTT
jgi:hypothetical protein